MEGMRGWALAQKDSLMEIFSLSGLYLTEGEGGSLGGWWVADVFFARHGRWGGFG